MTHRRKLGPGTRITNQRCVTLSPAFNYDASLIGDPCSRAKFSTKSPTRPCKRCGASRFRHGIQSAQQSKNSQQLDLFCLLRNLRHDCFLKIKERDFVSLSSLKATLRDLQKLHGKLSSLIQQAPQLKTKLSNLIDHLSIICTNGQTLDWEGTIQTIMDCDAVYYELYYTEITMSPNHSRLNHVPHPVIYFGESLEELNDAEQFVQQQQCTDESLLRARFSLDCNVNEEDALTVLHHIRFLETIQLFHLSGWLSRQEITSDFAKAARAPVASGLYGMHETPAPPMLGAWRDSCRDFLTHLYAYATMPRAIREAMQTIVGKERVVEVGAGTGYLASLLQRNGVTIDAFDCRPGEQNEYHGSTPTFLPIKAEDSSKVVAKETLTFVLLLCYPPPDSSMAIDTLRTFLNRGGKRIVHVGEFKGLTGTSAFERLLAKEFNCLKRFPCPTWGTDAASVTCWERKKQGDKIQSVLLPCVVCGKESQNRLRFIRYLTFCGAVCWEKHASSDLQSHCMLSSVGIGSDVPDFGCRSTFLAL